MKSRNLRFNKTAAFFPEAANGRVTSSYNVRVRRLSLFACFVNFCVFSLKLEATKDLAARKTFCLLMGDGVGDTTMADGLDVETLKESRPKLQSSCSVLCSSLTRSF